mmetsp:Transcript_97597/g.172837  ORF Transcript_97597/g.172837 Transcript_97597/m.172837 type:complete len:885 (-) Transcript_97597:283-2937(-)
MARLCDANGDEAIVGKSVGCWLSEDDFVSTDGLEAKSLGSLGFPRDWPNVYTTCKPLKSLIGKKGQCPGKKVGVVGLPTPEENATVRGLTFYPLQSFSNAESVEKATGMAAVHGWAVFEHLEKDVSQAFVAERYWWNAMPDGKWVDFTPRPEEWPELLLAEAANDAPKTKGTLTAEQMEILGLLLKSRFKVNPVKTTSTAPKAKASAVPSEAPKAEAATKPKSKAPQSIRDLTKRIAAGELDAVKELEEKARGNEGLCVQIVAEGISGALVKMLGEEAKRSDSLKLLLLLTDAGVGQKNAEVQNDIIGANSIAPLVKVITGGSSQNKELAAAVLGNLCHESPVNQDKIARAGCFQPLVDLLSADDIGPAQEAAYAIWNLTVGHEENSQQAVRCGAVPKLTELLKSTSDIAQENAAGALMHVTMSEEARRSIVQADAIPRLCELLSPSHEPEVSSQAAGALLNLASDCPDCAKMIVKMGAIGSLVNLVRDGPDLAREYAAGALMNLIRGDMEVAEKAAKEGAIPLLAGLLSKPSGHSEALGALANLASGSSERQIAIYKAQITRKSVAALGDPDIDVRRSAAALIMNLAPHMKIKERIVEAGAMQPLAACLKDSDDSVKERAAGALANLFNDHSGNVHAGFAQAPDMIPSLISMIQVSSHTDDAKRQAAHALAMLAAEDGPCDAVWSSGAGTPLLALLNDMVAEAALGIMNLSWRWPEVKQELAKGNALASLMQMLRTGDTMAKEYAAGALMNMTAGSKENAEKVTGVVPELVALLAGDGIQAAEWSAGALANVVRAGADAQKTAIDKGAAPHLGALLSKVTTNGKTLVVLALTSLAEGQAPSVMKAISGAKEKQKLREFRDSGSDELQDYTNALVEAIGNGYSL